MHSCGRTKRLGIRGRWTDCSGRTGTTPTPTIFCFVRRRAGLKKVLWFVRVVHGLVSDTSVTTPTVYHTRPCLPPHPVSLSSSTPSEKKTFQPLVLSAPGMTPLEVPVVHKVGPGGPDAGGEVSQVRVWKDECKGVDQGSAAASWLSEFLEQVSETEPQRRGVGWC